MREMTKRVTSLSSVVLLFSACGGATQGTEEPNATAASGSKDREHSPFLFSPQFDDPNLAALMQQKKTELFDAEVDGQGRISEFAHLIKLIDYVEQHTLTAHDQEQANGWFYQQNERIRMVFKYQMVEKEKLPADCVYFRAAARLSRWLTENLDRYEKEMQKTILLTLHGRAGIGPGHAYRIADAWASHFDLFAYDLGRFDAWREAGRPVDGTDVATDVVVCPRKPYKRRGEDAFLEAEFCSDVFYDYALDNDNNRRRFARYLLEKGDDRLVEAVFLNIGLNNGDAVVELLALLEESSERWAAAWRVVYRYADIRQRKKEIVKVAVRMWHNHPPLRGTVLFGLAFFSQRFLGTVNWETVKQTWGIEISEEDFALYLKESPISLSLSYVLWDAFTAGWSRADVLTPHLDTWSAAPAVTEYSPQDPDRALRYIIDAMCRERNRGDLKKMKTYLETRIAAHPDDPYAVLIRHTKNKQCAPRPRAESSTRYTAEEEGNTLRIIQTED